MGFLAELGSSLLSGASTGTEYLKDAFGSVSEAFGNTWDFMKDSPEAISGAVGIAKGIQGYYAAEDAKDAAKAQREAYMYGPRATEERLVKHNKGISDVADLYRKRKGMLKEVA